MKKLKTLTAVHLKQLKISNDLESYFQDTLFQTDEPDDITYFSIKELKTELWFLKKTIRDESGALKDLDPYKDSKDYWAAYHLIQHWLKLKEEIEKIIELLKANNVQVVIC